MSILDARPSVFDAISAVMDDVREVRKGDFNTEVGFAFRGIDAIVNAVAPALRTHGVVVVPTVKDITYRSVPLGQNRHQSPHVSVTVRYRWYGPNGDHVDSTVVGEAIDFGDKAVAKAMSVAWRITLLQTLALPTDDLDPDRASFRRSAPTDADDAREELARWLVAEGVDLQEAVNRWAVAHDNEHLAYTEDAAGIRALRDAWANERSAS